jgi:aminoglycoside 6-adenylyltransferase
VSGQPGIRAVIMVGSQTRRDHPADAVSDYDFQIFALGYDDYLSDTEWVHEIAPPWLTIARDELIEEPEILCLFEGGVKADFHFFHISDLEKMIAREYLHDEYLRGYTVLVDKDDMAAKLPPCPYKTSRREAPASEAYEQNAEYFWYGQLQAAKAIRRRDLWPAKVNEANPWLLEMLEWHAIGKNGGEYDVWFRGKFILDWIDPEFKTLLEKCFGAFDPLDSWMALMASVELYRRAATETAQFFDFEYPQDLDDNITGVIEEFFQEDRAHKEID